MSAALAPLQFIIKEKEKKEPVKILARLYVVKGMCIPSRGVYIGILSSLS